MIVAKEGRKKAKRKGDKIKNTRGTKRKKKKKSENNIKKAEIRRVVCASPEARPTRAQCGNSKCEAAALTSGIEVASLQALGGNILRHLTTIHRLVRMLFEVPLSGCLRDAQVAAFFNGSATTRTSDI
jgi:hypothetical protein